MVPMNKPENALSMLVSFTKGNDFKSAGDDDDDLTPQVVDDDVASFETSHHGFDDNFLIQHILELA